MEQYDKKDDYLEQLKVQIRCKKARNMVTDEIDQHIEDQKTTYIQEGDDENIAMVKALEQMGDPILVGKQLDKIHKPRLEWRILLAVLALCCLGVLVQFSIKNSIDESMLYNNINVNRHIVFLAMGFLLMVIVYFLDYSFIGKYPKAIWLLLLAVFFLYAPFGRRVNGQIPYLYAYCMLFVPMYGGILYAYRKKGYVGITKCILISAITCIIELRYVSQSSVSLGLLLSSLIMLSVAVRKNWFCISKRIGMAILWGALPLAFIVIELLNITIFNQYQMERFKSKIEIIMHPELYDKGYQMNIIRQIISHSKLFGGSTDHMIGFLPSLNNDNILTYVIGKWGIVAGVLVIGLFVVFIGRMIYISYNQKNKLGMFVGLGCSLVFAIQGSIYILSNLGFQLIAQVNLPFVSYGGSSLFINFIILGVMLSVFRNTNIMKEIPYKMKFVIKFEKVK